jgi:hypothetical protein
MALVQLGVSCIAGGELQTMGLGDEDQSHQRGRDTIASVTDKMCAIKLLNW